MKFVDLKKELKTKILPAYLLKGNDDFVLNKAYSLITDACKIEMAELNKLEFKGELIDIEDVVKALNTMPVFCDKKLVFVDLDGKGANDVKKITTLNEYFASPNETSVLVVRAMSIPAFFNGYTKHFEIVDCDKLDPNIVKTFFVKELAKYNKTISVDGFNLLLNYCNGDMSKLMNELTKLVSFVGDRVVVEKSDVETISTKTVEFQIFELTENLARKNAVKVYEILSTLKVRKDEFRGLLGLIYNHFRRLFFVSITKGTRDELASMLSVNPYAVTKATEQARLFTKKQLKDIVDECMRLDYETKNSNITPENAIDFLVLKILNY